VLGPEAVIPPIQFSSPEASVMPIETIGSSWKLSAKASNQRS
jgi:hypothetical protein